MKIRYYLITLLLLSGRIAYAQTDTVFKFPRPLFDFDYNKPTFKLENEQLTNQNKFLHASVLTSYREGVKSTDAGFGTVLDVYSDPVTGSVKVYGYNLSAQELLTNGWKSSQVILNVKDPSKFIYNPKYGDKETWLHKNAWCYEFILPREAFTDNTMKMIRNDIASQFNVKVVIEKRKLKEEDQETEFFIITELDK